MFPSTVAILINPPPISNKFYKFNIHRRSHLINPAFLTLKLNESQIIYRKSVRLDKTMASGITHSGGESDEHVSPAISALEQEALIETSSVSFHQTPGGLQAIVNHLSKWIVAACFGGLVLLRHDALSLWAAMGSVINMMLSVVLKKILKQERPVSRSNSTHGMPSSHAQAIFYTILFVIFSVVKWKGFSGVAAIVSMLVVAIGSYFSWLRVSQRYHTALQVVVGATVGSVFGALWFWAWEAVVHKAYESSLLVRVVVTIGGVVFSLFFISHVIQHWFKDED